MDLQVWLTVATVFFAAVVAVSTACYVRLTGRLVEETRLMRRAQGAPQVHVGVDPWPYWMSVMEMSIVNSGTGPAYDIRFELDEDFEYEKGKFLSQLPLFKNGIPYLAPGGERRFRLTTLVGDEYERNINKTLRVKTAFKNALGESDETEAVISFSDFLELQRFAPPWQGWAKESAEALKGIAAAIAKTK